MSSIDERSVHAAQRSDLAASGFDLAAARDYIANVKWQFARTMPLWPHEYTVRAWRPELKPSFEAFVRLIRGRGVQKVWPREATRPRYRLTYLELDGFEYWTMGDPVAETTVINRAVAEPEG